MSLVVNDVMVLVTSKQFSDDVLVTNVRSNGFNWRFCVRYGVFFEFCCYKYLNCSCANIY